MVDGAAWCIEIVRDKKNTIDVELHKIFRMIEGMTIKWIIDDDN